MPQNPKPHRLTICDRHPNLPTITGLCAPCLHERLSAVSSAVKPPEIRRSKSFSVKNSGGVVSEPRRRSCDVRGSNYEVELKNLGLTCPVNEVEDEDEDDDSVPEGKIENVRVCDFDFEEGKTMKEFIDLELESNGKVTNNRKDFKEIAGSFLGAASIFSKNLRKWRKKEENPTRDYNCNRNCSRNGDSNRNGNGNGNDNRVDVSLGELRLEDLRGRRLSYTQSEVGDYSLGRRSCDTDSRMLGRNSIDCGTFGRKSCDSDPRFSIDLGRKSVDESKIEFVDAPRASWDGYLSGRRGDAPVVSVIENAMASVYGFDDRVLGEGKVKVENGGVKRGKGSVKKDMDPVVVMSENAKISPTAIGIFNGTKLLITEKELNEWRLNCTKDDNSSESFETASKDLGSVSSSSVGKDEKKCRQWSKLWSVWGLINRRKGDKFGNEDELAKVDGTSVDDLARNGNRGALVRSYSTSSSRGSSSVVGFGSGTNSRADFKAIVKRRQDEGVLEKNRSVGYSPNHIDNGLLRFYLTPLRSGKRNRVGKSRLKKSHSLARSVLKLY